MKRTALLLLVVVPSLAACVGVNEADSVDPVMLGTRVGEGRFFDMGLDAECGKLSIETRIRPDDSANRSVGGATSGDREIRLETNVPLDSTMREAQLKLSREMGTDPLFSGR